MSATYRAQIANQMAAAKARDAERAEASRLRTLQIAETRELHVKAIVEAADQYRLEQSADNLENLCAEVVAAKAFCDELGPIVRHGSSIPRSVSFSHGAYISLTECLASGVFQVTNLIGASDDKLRLSAISGSVVARTIQRAADEPTPSNMRRAIAVLSIYLESFDFAIRDRGFRSVICQKPSLDQVKLKTSRGFVETPAGFDYADMWARAALV